MRLSDFYLDVLTPNTDDVYMLIYDRYRRNKIVFNSARNVPAITDSITVNWLNSLGVNGSIGADVDETWTIESTELVQVNGSNIDNDLITISLSGASVGAADPENIDEITFDLKGEKYEYEMNMLISLKVNNLELKEVGIDTIYLENNKASHFNPIYDSMRIYFLLFRFLISSVFASIIDFVFFIITISITKNIFISRKWE